MKNELPNYNKKVGGYVVFNKDGKTAITNDGTKGGYFYGDSHQDPSNGISAIVDNDRPILVEGNEVIINKKTVQSEKVLTIKGTPKEILSTLNQMDGNGVAIGDEEAEILAKYRTGGRIPREKQIYLGKEGGSNVSPKGMFESAVQMENEGIDSETIRSITGWFRNPFDKLWRFEISDREAKINLSKIASAIKKVVSSKSEVTLSLKDVYTNNELSKAYGKSIEELPFVFYYDDEDEGLGRLNIIPLAGKVFIKLNVYEFLRGNVEEVESTVAERGKLFISFTTHELQHAIQIREGLSAGGSVEQEYRKLLKEHKGVSEREDRLENNRKTREDILLEQARLNYLNHLGEIEASDSDVRKFFDKKTRIEIPPYSLINFNNEEVIVIPETKIKFRTGGELIKRADGSYSRRGLWDNIRDNVGSGRKPTKQMLEQEAKIKSKYHLGGDMSKHLAPNGKPSKLNHEQWHLVRSPEFIEFFGDWINSPETASKVIDENGEPLVVYHGTEKEFTVFDLKKIGEWSGNLGHYGYGFYFSYDIKEAKGYGSKILNCFLNIKKPFLGTYDEFDLLKDNGFTGIDDKVALSIDFKDLHNKIKSIDMNAYNFMSIAEKNGLDNVWNLYLKSKESNEEGKVDLNDLYDILSFTDLAKENNSVPDFIIEDIESIGIEPKLNMGYENPQSLHWVTDLGNNSKEFTDFIKTLNYDGVIYGSEYVALNPNQIKLADGTNTTFDANNDDIRFDKGGLIEDSNGYLSYTIDEDEITLDMIKSYDKRKGTASKLIEKLKDLSREKKLPIGLYAEPQDFSISDDDLIEFYYKNGFELDPDDSDGKLFIWKYKKGGSISKMTPSELKEFYASPEGKKLDAQTYSEWDKLVNMTKSELEKFYNSVEGKKAGLTTSQAKEQGIDSGRESARWVLKMKDIPYKEWSSDMWRWAKKQIGFIKRMTGMRGKLYNDKGEKTRKHTALLIWGHNPEQKFKGGGDIKGYDNFKNPILINGFISNKEIDGKEIFLITYNSGGQEGLDVHQTMNPLAMLDAVEKKTGLHTNTLQVFIYEHTENSNRIETEDELEFLKDNYTVIIVDRDSVEFYNGDNPKKKFAEGGGLRKFKGGGELSKKALAVETNDLKDFVRKYFIGDGRIDVSDAMQELFGNKRGKSIAGEYRKRIGLHKKGGLTISQLAHNLWEEHQDEVRGDIDDSDFRAAVEDVLISEYGVSSMIKSLMEKSEGGEQDKESEFWMNQFDEGDDEYYEDLSDKEVADYFKDMEGFERETYKDEDKKIIISGVEIPKEIDELFKEKYELDYYYSFYGKILNSFPKDEMGLTTDSARATKEYKDVKQKYDLAKRKADNFNTSKEGKELSNFYSKIDRMSRIEIMKYYTNQAEELAKGTQHEMEHLDTLKKVAEGKLTPEEAVVQTAKTHIKENPEYYEDLAKMEEENKETYTYALTIRPFDLGTYPKENFIRLVKENYKFGLLEYSKPLSDRDIKHYSLAPVSELMKYDGKEYYYYEDLKAKMNVIRDEDNTPFAKVTEFDENNNVVQEYTINSNVFLQKIESLNYRFIDDLAVEEESIPDLIEGLKILAESLEGSEKKEIEDVIEGLEILLESDNKFAEGGGIEAVLWATKIGEPDWNEQIITENASQIEDAKKWALANGFDRLRVSTIDNSKPDFTKGFKIS